MKFKALSVANPGGTRIANKEKVIEVRQWQPEVLPLRDLLIVENEKRLSSDCMPTDPNGSVVAIVDVVEVDEWKENEVSAACASYWENGWLGWRLENVRKIKSDCTVPAKLRIYEVELDEYEVEEREERTSRCRQLRLRSVSKLIDR